MSQVARFTAIAKAAAVLQQEPETEVREIGDALAEWLADSGTVSLDRALGLRRQPGQRSQETIATIAERDRHIREAAARFFSHTSTARAAAALHVALGRYEGSGWRRGECSLGECPASRRDTLQEYCWRILRTHDHVPSAERIRKILVTS